MKVALWLTGIGSWESSIAWLSGAPLPTSPRRGRRGEGPLLWIRLLPRPSAGGGGREGAVLAEKSRLPETRHHRACGPSDESCSLAYRDRELGIVDCLVERRPPPYLPPPRTSGGGAASLDPAPPPTVRGRGRSGGGGARREIALARDPTSSCLWSLG